MNTINTKALSIFIGGLLFVSLTVMGQEKRASPPASTSATINGAQITINYSQPSVKGRTIMGGLVPFDKVWRTGANEATTFEVSKDVKVEGQNLKAGKYALFTVPGKQSWKIIFNSNPKQWGSYSYAADQDILTVEAKPESTDFTEVFTINANDDGTVTLMWEKTKVSFKVE